MKNGKDENMENSKIGIIGSHSIEYRKNGDILETRTGSFTYSYIPSFFIVVEDDLAKKVVELIACDFISLSIKYIIAGTWGNQASCIFGFIMYAKQLECINIPHFSIISIDDGDIKKEYKEKRINAILKGNYYGEELKTAKKSLSNLMYSFDLEFLSEDIKGLPEFNHKKWFEEINEKAILSVTKPSNIYEERQIESLIDIIAFSKSLDLTDYHSYYEELKKFSFKNTLDMFHMTEKFVLGSIKKYNNNKWKLYTNNVKEALLTINESNTNTFINSKIRFQK